MRVGLVDTLIPEMDAFLKESSEMLAFSSDPALLPLPLDPSRFHAPGFFSEGALGTLTAIDGGNSEILSGPQFSVQCVRVAAVTFTGKRCTGRKVREGFCLITTDTHTFHCRLFGLSGSFSFPALLETLDGQRRRLEAGEAGGMVRRMLELELAAEISEGAVLVDGSMQCFTEAEEKRMSAALSSAEKRGACIAFLSKTCSLLTKNGKSLSAALHELGPKGTWRYAPVFRRSGTAEGNTAEARAKKGRKAASSSSPGETSFVRLHPRSRHVFRLETAWDAKPQELLPLLISHASDAAFPGYPYCLIEADRAARVSNEERDYLRTLLLAKTGMRERLDLVLSGSDAHSVLDSIR